MTVCMCGAALFRPISISRATLPVCEPSFGRTTKARFGIAAGVPDPDDSADLPKYLCSASHTENTHTNIPVWRYFPDSMRCRGRPIGPA